MRIRDEQRHAECCRCTLRVSGSRLRNRIVLFYDRARGTPRRANSARIATLRWSSMLFARCPMCSRPNRRTGSPTRRCVGDSHDSGVALGSGCVMVADERFSAVTILLWILQFFENESCGKCTPCRVGTRQLRELVQRIEAGNGQSGDVDRLMRLSDFVERTSFCGLGQSVAWPVASAVECFPSDFQQLGAS
jgi:hypothetical protein